MKGLANLGLTRHNGTSSPGHRPGSGQVFRMNRRVVVAGSLLIVLSCIAFGMLGVMTFGFLLNVSDLCSDAIWAVVPSPDGRTTASLHEVNCGATTPFVAQVQISSGAAAPAQSRADRQPPVFTQSTRITT